MTIRVLLDASTTLVRSALTAALGDCPDIELVDGGEFTPPPTTIDVIVVQRPAFEEYPAVGDASRFGIVAINDDGDAGDLYQIRRSSWRFASDGCGGLADAIRAVASAS